MQTKFFCGAKDTIMNTGKWGRSAWIVLHTITMHYKPGISNVYKRFFQSVGYILPCKYCRDSYQEFLRIYSTKNPQWYANKTLLMQSLYDIHNMVNEKLRNQGLLTRPNPTYSAAYQRFQRLTQTTIEEATWEFLYALAFNYQVQPGADQRMAYSRFLKLLPDVLPPNNVQKILTETASSGLQIRGVDSSCLTLDASLQSRYTLVYHLYLMQCITRRRFQKRNNCQFREICKRFESWRAGCKQNTCSVSGSDGQTDAAVKDFCDFEKVVRHH